MARHDWMRGEHTAERDAAPSASTVDERLDRRSRLETMLACAGIAVWLFSAYEMLLTALR